MRLIKQRVISLLPKRPKDANKGTFGKVLVIAGSENYPGAAYLACAACYRVGAGQVLLSPFANPALATASNKKLIIANKKFFGNSLQSRSNQSSLVE